MQVKAWLLAGCCLLAFGISAQVQRIEHQTFDVSDSVKVIELTLFGDVAVESWAGNNILLETQIKLFNAKESILNHLLEIGRYQLEDKIQGTVLMLSSKDKERKPLKTDKGDCFEEVKQKLFLPEEFKPAGPNRYQRELAGEAEQTTPKKQGNQQE